MMALLDGLLWTRNMAPLDAIARCELMCLALHFGCVGWECACRAVMKTISRLSPVGAPLTRATLRNASGHLMTIIRDMSADWHGQPGVDRLGFTLREFNLSGATVAARPVEPVAWVIKGKGKGAPVGQGQGTGNLPSHDDDPWTGPWAVTTNAFSARRVPPPARAL